MSSKIEKLYKSRFSNYSSKTEVDEEALWARISQSDGKSGSFFGKKSLLIIGVAVTFSAVASLFTAHNLFYNNKSIDVPTGIQNSKQSEKSIPTILNEDSSGFHPLLEQNQGGYTSEETSKIEDAKESVLHNPSSIESSPSSVNNNSTLKEDKISNKSDSKNTEEIYSNKESNLFEAVTDTIPSKSTKLEDENNSAKTFDKTEVELKDIPTIKYVKKPVVVKDTVYKVKRKIRTK